ncbi:hypothetical protein RD792_003891 [Penstemon davidsonii]|uniref:F-box/LRR-repeat protein 15/At3g58940/PEG3-like LRR domain-containing protein n=1 Tax=Penstemon davidsonii TaxID=160366 RepID=A0ABR0DFY5_9LAMI|nr:hypothetical protein RD792_003891 [Penstemon davidsonii]
MPNAMKIFMTFGVWDFQMPNAMKMFMAFGIWKSQTPNAMNIFMAFGVWDLQMPNAMKMFMAFGIWKPQTPNANSLILTFGIWQISSRLRTLQLVACARITGEGLIKAVKNLPLLEELHLNYTYIGSAVALIETVGRSCLHLKSFELNYRWCPCQARDLEALAIAENMPELRHLHLFGNRLTDEGMQAILDGCPNLESLDLRQCRNVDFGGNLRRLCEQRIKDLRAPDDDDF